MGLAGISFIIYITMGGGAAISFIILYNIYYNWGGGGGGGGQPIFANLCQLPELVIFKIKGSE